MLEARIVVARGSFELRAELDVAGGEVVAVVGPNGAGKTTLLRALAGLEPLDAGAIRLGGRLLDAPDAGCCVPPEARGVGYAFQDHRLFPHLSALENAAFGLRARGVSRDAARRRAAEWLARLGAADLAARRPAALSGGQSQAVALARVLATEPGLLLLDEPLAAIDAAAGVALRRLLAVELAARSGATLLVTHDPVEAAVLGSRIVVLEAGRVVQEGDARAIAARPRSDYVAALVGVNLWRGEADGAGIELAGGGRLVGAHALHGSVLVVVHPRAVALHRERPAGSPRNVWAGAVASVEAVGEVLRVRIDAAPPVVAEITPGAAADLGVEPGATVWASVKATEVEVTPA
jgi:molybdate transport system ATP-binding protein